MLPFFGNDACLFQHIPQIFILDRNIIIAKIKTVLFNFWRFEMSVKKIEHIGIAVKDLTVSIPLFEKLLGVKCYLIEEVEEQKVKTAFFKVGETKIELLEATAEDSPIAKFISKRGEGLHHIALDVENIEQSLASLKKKATWLCCKSSSF